MEINIQSHGVSHTVLIDDSDISVLNRHWRIKKGYATTRFYAGKRNGKSIQREVSLHRLLLGDDLTPDKEVDHVNRNKLDNRRCNLRIVTGAENRQNVGAQQRNMIGLRGVHWDKTHSLYKAVVRMNGVIHSLGYFVDPIEAGTVVSDWRSKNMVYAVERG